MSGHTPGPWEAVIVDEDGTYTEWKISPDVASIYYVNKVGAANARLIAVAPLMLHELYAAVAQIEALGGDASTQRAAIRKATEEA